MLHVKIHLYLRQWHCTSGELIAQPLVDDGDKEQDVETYDVGTFVIVRDQEYKHMRVCTCVFVYMLVCVCL